MKQDAIYFDQSDAAINYIVRKLTIGPEHALVMSFLENGIDGDGYSFRSDRMAVFVEPRIDSGFPDIVIAQFRPDFMLHWRQARNELGSSDLKLLSFLHSVKKANSAQICEQLRMQPTSILRSVELLLDADLISRDKKSRLWLPKPVAETFGLERIVALEAKVCNSKTVLDQAALNCWFASESYALTPTPVTPNSEFSKLARSAGVGIVSGTPRRSFRRIVRPRQLALPSGYASWQFNEWVGKRLSKEGA